MQRLSATPLILILASTLAGCVERGDFGRVKTSAWNSMVGQTGSLAAAARGEPVSGNPFTDDETELRDRAWRFLVPGRDRPWFDRILAELVATRIVPPDLIGPDRQAYHRGLLEDQGRSPVSLYRRLSEDAAADLRLVEPFARVAAEVLAADRIRLRALGRAAEVSPDDVGDARARVAENRCLIAWVTAASAFRVAAYAYALDHLVIEAPQRDAGPTERVIAALRVERIRLERLGVRPLAAASCAGEVETIVRPMRNDAPLVRKG
ncbi:hypothetical protein [uncultured Enterovirga sp.]|uniref:hypothetical protein n=1 Tax=uncultured Enterovirga sp. TaxID=2026352 RepID=UPI0035C98AFE